MSRTACGRGRAAHRAVLLRSCSVGTMKRGYAFIRRSSSPPPRRSYRLQARAPTMPALSVHSLGEGMQKPNPCSRAKASNSVRRRLLRATPPARSKVRW